LFSNLGEKAMALDATREKWRGLIQRQAGSEQTVKAFCRRHGVSTASFYAWKRKLQEDASGGEPSLFTPVTVVGHSASAIEVRFRCGAVMRLPTSDEQSLRRVTELLLGETP